MGDSDVCLTGTGFGHAFATTAVLQVVLLGVSAVVAMFLPRRIAPGAYQRRSPAPPPDPAAGQSPHAVPPGGR